MPAARTGSNTEVKAKSLIYVVILATVTAISGFLFGFDSAVINGVLLLLRRQFTLSNLQTEIAASSSVVGVLAGSSQRQHDGAQAFADLARYIARGSTAIFLAYSTLVDPGVTEKTPIALRWAPFPLAAKPSIGEVPTWYFRADHWAKEHPIFEGLPCGGIMNYTFYREILSARVFTGLQPPLEAVSGALDTREGYHSDLLVSVHTLGEGRFIPPWQPTLMPNSVSWGTRNQHWRCPVKLANRSGTLSFQF